MFIEQTFTWLRGRGPSSLSIMGWRQFFPAIILEKYLKKELCAPRAAAGGSSETNEGIVENPIRGGKTSSDSCSDSDLLLGRSSLKTHQKQEADGVVGNDRRL